MSAPTPPVSSVNPIQATNDPEYTSYRWSRAISPIEGDKSSEILAKGGAEALGHAVNASDSIIKNTLSSDIEKEGGALVEARNAMLAHTLASIQGVQGTETDGPQKLDVLTTPPKGSDLPAGVKDIGKSLDVMAMRRANGSVSETKFLGDMDAAAKKYRNMWPGYTKEIDSEFERVSQRGVANDLARSMTQDINAYNAAAKEQKSKLESLMQHAMEVDHIPGSDRWPTLFESGKKSADEIRHMYVSSMGRKYEADRLENEWKITEYGDKNRQNQAEHFYNHDVNNTIADVVTTISAETNPQKVLQEVREGKTNPIHAEQVSSSYDAIIAQAYQASTDKLMNTKDKDGHTMYENIGAEKAKALFEDNPRIKLLRFVQSGLTGTKDHSVAMLAHNQLEAGIQHEQWKLANSDSLEGRAYTGSLVWQNAGAGGKLVADLLQSGLASGALGHWATSQQMLGGAQADKELTGDDKDLYTFKKSYDEAILNGQKDPRAFSNIASDISRHITDKNVPDRLKAGWMDYSYDGSNLPLLEQLAKDHRDPATGRMIPGKTWFYQNLTGEDHAAEVARVARTSGHPELWTKYQNYVEMAGKYLIDDEVNKSTIIQTVKNAGGYIANEAERLISDNIPDPEKSFRFSYDNEANKFYVSPTSSFRPADRRYKQDMQDSVDKINTVVKSVSAMNKYSGGDPNVWLYNTLTPLAERDPRIAKMLSALVAAHQETETP